MPSPIAPFTKHDFDHLWKSDPPKNEVYITIRKLLEGKIVQLLEDASHRVDTSDKIIKLNISDPVLRLSEIFIL